MKFIKISNASNLLQRISSFLPQIVSVAQNEYDSWEQDEEGFDEALGHSGGICQDIAERICELMNSNGIDCITQDAMVGDQHVWAVAYDEGSNKAFMIDISPYVYESGGGYSWQKLPDVIFSNNDVIIEEVNWDDFKWSLEDTY